jgi:DNA-binding GntR family transcriptional regulator
MIKKLGLRHSMKGTDIYSFLRQAITTGRYVPGQRLSERELANELKVSRTPVREALRLLMQDGIVAYRPNSGYQVTKISESLVQNIMIVREALECLAVRLTCQCDPIGTAKKMRKTIEQGRKAYEEGQLSGLITANQQFHSLLVEGSRNPFLESLYHILQAYIGMIMSVSLSWPRRPAKTLKEHMEIIEALMSGNPGKAERAVRTHIRKALKGVLKNVELFITKE